MGDTSDASANEGVRYALLAYCSWGLLPIYWKALKEIPAFEILCHRLFWSLLFYTLLRLYKEKRFALFSKMSGRELFYLSLATLLLASNWGLYIYAVNSDHIVESSLGYFINPLFNILLGVAFLNETLQKHHKKAIVLISVGVLLIAIEAHKPPWIALALALTFGLYGFARKKIPTNSLSGGQLETLLMLPITLGYFYFHRTDLAAHTPHQWILLAGTGIVTGFPLLWFTEAVKRMPYYLMGFFQFIAPSMMFLCGILIYQESLSLLKLGGFIFIWSGALYLISHAVQKKYAAKQLKTLAAVGPGNS